MWLIYQTKPELKWNVKYTAKCTFYDEDIIARYQEEKKIKSLKPAKLVDKSLPHRRIAMAVAELRFPCPVYILKNV